MKNNLERDRDDLKRKRPATEPVPTRSYELPGGPYAKSLGETKLKITAEFQRGSEQDRGYGGRR